MSPSDGGRLPADAITYLIHHVVLPPKLPQESDYDASYERYLLDVVIRALKAVQNGAKDMNAKAIVASGITSIENLRDSRDNQGNVSEHQLGKVFQRLAFATTNESVPLEIKAQNAGLLISRCDQDIIFESFELSPVNNATMSSLGRVVRHFPGSTSKLPGSTMQDEAFRRSLAYTIAKMTTQAAPGTQPRVRKNGQSVDEDRDTTHPMMVTDWLTNYIASLGETTSLERIAKNTREEVLWNNCRHPWRRSSLWLLVRVALQLQFTRHKTFEKPHHGLYKASVAQILSHILVLAQENWECIGSEALYIVYAKLARRFRKMENLGQLGILQPRWGLDIKSSMIDTYRLIENHWTNLLKGLDESIDTALLRDLKTTRSLDLALPKLDIFLSTIAARLPYTACVQFKPSLEYPTYPARELPTISSVHGEYKFLRLLAFETWVEQHLSTWLLACLSHQDTCRHLKNLMDSYHSVASAAYEKLPSSLSVMCLTLLELWIACDRSACHIHPLLAKYSPELFLDEFQCLILKSKHQMKRLVSVERYLQSRHETALTAYPSVFRDFGGASSFAVKYFERSLELQELLSIIERDAAEKQRKKREELANLKRQYRDLMERYNNQDCETHEVVVNWYHGYTETKHKPQCTRCALKRKADAMDIDIYEWPLSSNSSTAKATVFELRIPEAFSDWRDATMYLMATVLGCRGKQPARPQFEYTLDMHHGISSMLSPRYFERRIIPLSSIKAHSRTHRKQKKAILHVEDRDVCLPNALRYAYFDKVLGIYTGPCELTGKVSQNCMHRMPRPQSKALERFIYKPPSAPDGLFPNEVISSLSDCPSHFSIDEYKNFGMLPFGRNILYSNILAQLATPTVDFSKVETQTLLLQIIWQVGVPHKDGDPRRVSHRILATESFGCALLEQIDIAFNRVAENWESWRALASFVALARRALSLTLSSEVRTRSLIFLEKARRVSMEWLWRLKRRATDSVDDKQRNDLYSRATEVALVCTSTFDVDDELFEVVLQQESAISMLLQCSIVVQENHDSVLSEYQDIYQIMLQSWKASLYRMFPSLCQQILRDNTGLNNAVYANWAAFQPTIESGWVVLSKPFEHWLCTESGSLPVHFNLITGELLVKGLPLARLPSKYMKHPMYKPLFQSSILEVVPTDKPGMEFSVKMEYHGYELHFGMGGTDIYVIAIRDGVTLDLLPSRLFQDRLPSKFAQDYIHWYDHSRNIVVFRPRNNPWSFEDVAWKLIRWGSGWRMVNGTNVLTSVKSHTARIISKIFSPIEDEQHIHTIFETTTQLVLVHFPRLQLDFYVKPKGTSLHSRQYRGMVVDPDQTIGALVGLTSKMVLKSIDPLQDRLVLIPVPHTYEPRALAYNRTVSPYHVSVTINKDQACGVYSYSLDSTLGRILDGGDVQRRLFLSLMFAITSHCLPDPLTGYTGTESALQILKSAAVRSFEFLTAENVELLGRISALSPVRVFYPKHLTEMQQVEWDKSLPVLSQHPHFRKYAKEIIRQAERMQLFFPNSTPDTSRWKSSNPHLETRDEIRSSTFRICNFGGELFTSEKDILYDPRDICSHSERGRRAYVAATLLVRDEVALHHRIPNLKDTMLQTYFRDAKISGASVLFRSTASFRLEVFSGLVHYSQRDLV